METRGGLWNHPRPSHCSKETQEMLRVRKEESMLLRLQRNQIQRSTKRKSVKAEAALSKTSDCGRSAPLSKSADQQRPRRTQKRSAESCRAGNSYETERFQPGPIRDCEAEKKRLQSIMERGNKPTAGLPKKTSEGCKPDESQEMDRYQEVVNEIEERRNFLTDMAALGQEQQYIGIINVEISQRLRELDILDQAGCSRQKMDKSITTSGFNED